MRGMLRPSLFVPLAGVFILALLLLPLKAMAMTPAGTVIGNAATATYYDEENNQYTTTSNIVQTTVAEVCAVTVDGGGTYEGVPGQEIYIPFTVTNKGNGENTFNLSTSGGTYTKRIFLDENQNGVVDPGENEVSSITLGMGETAHIVVAVQIPSDANGGDSDSFTLTAEGTDPAGCSEDQSATVNVVEDALIQANKQVDKDTASPEDTLTYTITFRNVGTRAAKAQDGFTVDLDGDGNPETGVEGLLIKDQIPSGSTYVSGSASGQPTSGFVVYSPDGNTWYKSEGDAVNNGGVKYVGFFIPDDAPQDDSKGDVLDPDQEGYLTLKVRVNSPFDDPDQSVDNKATVLYDDSTGNDKTVETNETHTTVPASATADIAVSDQKANVSDVEDDSAAGADYTDDNTKRNVPAGSWVVFTHSAANRSLVNDDVIELSVDDANSNLPSGAIVEFWNADGTAKLIDTDGDGKVDLGTVPANSKQDFIVKVFIPADVSAPQDGTVDYYVTILATSHENPGEEDRSRDNIDGVVGAGVDIGKVNTVGDDIDNPSDGNTDGTNDSDDVLPADNGNNGIVNIVDPGQTAVYVLEVANTGSSPDQFNLSASGNPAGTSVSFYTDPNCDGDSSDGEQITETPLLGGTTLSADANAGDTTISVYSVANITAGDTLIIGAGTSNLEVVTVQSVDVENNQITLTSELANDHSAGEKVSERICLIMKVETEAATPAGEYNIVVEAESENSGASNNIDAYLKVNAICSVSVSPDHSDQLPPGGTTTYQHTVTNEGNVNAKVTITVPSSGTQLNYVILDSSQNPVGTTYVINNLAPGDSVTFYIKVNAPSGVPAGTVESIDVTADADIDGDDNTDCSNTATDTTTVIEGYLQLTKEATTSDTDGPDNAGNCTGNPDGVNPGPCDEITYKIKYKNIGSQDALDVVITDQIPDHTTYVPNSLCLDTDCDGNCDTNLTDSSGDDQAEYDSVNNLVRFRVGEGAYENNGGTLHPDDEGCVIFRVKIQ
ncbi:hypothetical protein [Thermovibrio sp.]